PRPTERRSGGRGFCRASWEGEAPAEPLWNSARREPRPPNKDPAPYNLLMLMPAQVVALASGERSMRRFAAVVVAMLAVLFESAAFGQTPKDSSPGKLSSPRK